MRYVLTFTFVQHLVSLEPEPSSNRMVSEFSPSMVSEIESKLKSLIEKHGRSYVGITSEMCNRSRVTIHDVSPAPEANRYHYTFSEKNDLHVHTDQLHNSFRFRYLHVIYEGEEIPGSYLTFDECMEINCISMKAQCSVVNYGRGEHGELATLQLGYAVYEAVALLVAYQNKQFPVFILPFHPLEHFWTLTDGDTTKALIDYDEWYERFRALERIFRHLGVNFNVIIGHRTWLVNPPSIQELENYCASKVLSGFLKSEVSLTNDKKENSDTCHVINVEGAFNELLVTVVNWYQQGLITNTDLYYEISGPAPMDMIYAFCERYNIQAKTDVKMIEDVSSDAIDSINSNIQRSLIF